MAKSDGALAEGVFALVLSDLAPAPGVFATAERKLATALSVLATAPGVEVTAWSKLATAASLQNPEQLSPNAILAYKPP